jgi:hypothetical protein
MNVLAPVQTSQELKIIPRGYRPSGTDYKITLIEDGTGKTETITNVSADQDGNYMVFTVTFTILTNKSIYYMEVERDNKVKFRGKVYCTDRSDKKIKQSLNNNKYTEYSAAPTGQKYITV